METFFNLFNNSKLFYITGILILLLIDERQKWNY